MLKSIALFALLNAAWASAQATDVLYICTEPNALQGDSSCTVFTFDFSVFPVDAECISDLGALANGAAQSVRAFEAGFGCVIYKCVLTTWHFTRAYIRLQSLPSAHH
ncbi:hypothetical protein BT96DRAFT_913673 [Gymnopus androsaceus JB14]|uniref:Extracellular membrane protein CFEM domain-containing protein n=1 Tax=Gymnopus androsaceus JB14 TaxID=1447944 RepID=A0A6A4IID7_9AGAR|nr:hypothetical protein BT96DRAFT_913673 [Gymnopus androsaceus JB14]